MKRLIIFTLMISLLLSGCGKEEPAPETLTQEELIYGPTVDVTQPLEDILIPEDQEAVTEPKGDTTTLRVLRRMSVLNENGEESWYREYEYDAQGRLASEREANAGGVESYRAEYTYGDHVQTATYTYADGTVEEITELLDDQGRVKSRKTSAPPGEPPYAVLEYTYDEYGNQLTCRQTLDDMESIQSFTYTYGQEGRVQGEEETMDGELVAQRQYFYDDQGRIAESLNIDASGIRYSILHTWEGSTETITTLNPDETVAIVTIHTYDEMGNLLLDETQQEGSVISCAEYTYEDIEISGN